MPQFPAAGWSDKNCLNVDNMHEETRGHILERRLWTNTLWLQSYQIMKPSQWLEARQAPEDTRAVGGNHWHSQYAGNVSVNRLRGGVSGYPRDKHEMNRVRRMDGDFWTGLTTYTATTVSVSGDTRPNTPSLRLQEDQRYAQMASLFPKPQFYHHCLFSWEG